MKEELEEPVSFVSAGEATRAAAATAALAPATVVSVTASALPVLLFVELLAPGRAGEASAREGDSS